jgi:hypothetical protein
VKPSLAPRQLHTIRSNGDQGVGLGATRLCSWRIGADHPLTKSSSTEVRADAVSMLSQRYPGSPVKRDHASPFEAAT